MTRPMTVANMDIMVRYLFQWYLGLNTIEYSFRNEKESVSDSYGI